MNGVCGVQSVLSSMRYLTTNNVRDLYTSMYLMPLGMLFDFMDGRVARWRNNSSLLGQELDSLADLVNKKKTSILQAFLLKKKKSFRFPSD
jgi:CDP-diacylglycerol--serine O-phosphatidyltransferase